MDSVTLNCGQKSDVDSNRSIENKRNDVLKDKTHQQTSATLKQQKKIMKQLVGENMERMNYLYQCASLAAKMCGHPDTPRTELGTAQPSSFSSAKSPNRCSSSASRKEILPHVDSSPLSKISTNETSGSLFSYKEERTCAVAQPSRPEATSSVTAPSSLSSSRLPALAGENSTLLTATHSHSQTLRGSLSSLHPEIASSLGSTCRAIGRKCQLRMSHVMKRELCPSCYTPLLPSVTASAKIIRVRKKRVLVLKCRTCRGVRKRPCQDVKILWSDKTESRLQ